MLQKYMMAKEFYTTEKAGLIQQSMHRYSISSYILFFFTFSFAGWLWEVLLHVFIDHTVVNRGVLYGPWLPIYGFGGVLILLLLRRFAERPLQVFLMTMLTAGTMEFVTGTVLWKVYQMRWWDYRDSLINLKGFASLWNRRACDPLFRGAEIKRSVPETSGYIPDGSLYLFSWHFHHRCHLFADASKCRIRGNNSKAIIPVREKEKVLSQRKPLHLLHLPLQP